MSNYPYDPNGRPPYDPHAQTEPAAGRPFSGGGMPYEPENSLTPPPPPQYSMNPSYTNYPPQSFQQFTPPPAGKPKSSTAKIGIIVSIVAVLVIAGFVGIFALVIGKPGGPTVSATPTPVPYPALASSYAGTVRNSTSSSRANVSFTSIAQTKGDISGNITVGLPLVGSGPFSGTISSSGSVRLVDVSNDGSNVKITFTGSVSANKSMSGTYSVDNNQGGSWQVVPTAAPVVYPVLYAKYSGTFMNNSTGKAGAITLAFASQNQQAFSGTFMVANTNAGLTGTVGSDNSIQFTVTASDATITFNGSDNTDGSLSGTYIYTATSASAGTNANGTWKVSPG